jgi:hypothetical protein
MALQDGAENTEMREANLPDNLAIYLSGGYVTGNVGELPGYNQPNDMTGFYIAGGLEYYPSDNTMVGVSGYYNSFDADTPLAQRAESQTYAASLYARHKIDGGSTASSASAASASTPAARSSTSPTPRPCGRRPTT